MASWEIPDFLDIQDGNLHIEGVNAVDLAREYGTPLFFFSEKRIRHNSTVSSGFSGQFPVS